MSVKVSLLASGKIVEMRSDDHVSLREVGWATERVRELIQNHDITGILADSRDVIVSNTPAFSGEIFENFLLAMDQPMPIAYVRPAAWSTEFEQLVRQAMLEEPVNVEVFEDRKLALDWLEQQACEKSLSA